MLTISIDFYDGLGPHDYTHLLRSAVRRPATFTESFRHATGQADVVLRFDVDLMGRFTAAARPAAVTLLQDGAPYWRGLAAPTGDGSSEGWEGGASDFSIEVLDFTTMLDADIDASAGISWDDQVLFDASDPARSIIHRLLSLRGISATNPGLIGIDFEAFAVESGNYGQLVEELLYEHGYGYTFDAAGAFTIVPWAFGEGAFDHTALPLISGDEGLVETLSYEQIEREAQLVEVSWWSLKYQSGVFVFIGDLPIGPDGQRSGQPVQPGLKWPEEANVQETWWTYTDTPLSETATASGPRVSNKDFTQIVQTRNHELLYKADPGLTVESELQNKRARVAFANPTSGVLNVFWVNIKADVVYRGAVNVVTAEVVSGGGAKKKTVEAPHILTSAQADHFARALAAIYRSGNWRYEIRTTSILTPGSVFRMQEDGLNIDTVIMVISGREDPETGVYSYRAVSLATPSFGTLTRASSPRGIRTQRSPQTYLTYHDNPEATQPPPPDGDGNQGGWHRALTEESVWTSSKIAELPEDGVWSPAVLLRGPAGPAGEAGPEGATYRVEYESTNGLVFKPGEELMTYLVAHAYRNEVEITDQLSEGAFRWRRKSRYPQPYPNDDETWNSLHTAGKVILVTLDDVTDRCDIVVDLWLEEEQV